MGRFFVSGCTAALAVGLSSCASLMAPADPVEPLVLAFTEPVPSLEARAARGENAAEYALSFLSVTGLRGVPHDRERADRLRAGAMSPTTLMITQYVPAIGGGTGRTHPIPITQPGMTREAIAMLDMCGLSAFVGDDAAGPDSCTPAGWERLAPLGRQLLADEVKAARTPLP
jgi:hypothetical protein